MISEILKTLGTVLALVFIVLIFTKGIRQYFEKIEKNIEIEGFEMNKAKFLKSLEFILGRF
jgi:hypothetical protein